MGQNALLGVGLCKVWCDPNQLSGISVLVGHVLQPEVIGSYGGLLKVR